MVHNLLIGISVSAALVVAVSPLNADEKDPAEKVDFTHYRSGYFEKNNSGLKGESTHLVIRKKDDFDRVFGFGRVMGPKPTLLPADAESFNDLLVVACIKRGTSITEYAVESVTRKGTKLTVNYRATAKDGGGSATFASPMIVSVKRGNITAVEFRENGKVVAETAVPK